MFDFTKLARACGFAFLGYLIGVPVLAVLDAILDGGLGQHWFDDLVHLWFWPVPCVFGVLSLVLLVDFLRSLSGGRLTTTQVTGHRAAALFLLAGAAFGFPVSWIPAAVSALCWVVMMLPAKKHAAASTWAG